jgi:hypothetical protein
MTNSDSSDLVAKVNLEIKVPQVKLARMQPSQQ